MASVKPQMLSCARAGLLTSVPEPERVSVRTEVDKTKDKTCAHRRGRSKEMLLNIEQTSIAVMNLPEKCEKSMSHRGPVVADN